MSRGLYVRGTPTVRFLARAERGRSPDDCWLWRGCLQSRGYGSFHYVLPDGREGALAHRFAYELFVGPIPDGLVIDHLCRNPICVNPQHLEAVTNLENLRRGVKGELYTHCVHGHEMTAENTIWRKHKNRAPSRTCRICKRAAGRRGDAKRRGHQLAEVAM